MTPAELIRAAEKATKRENTPAAYLQEAVKAFDATTNPSFPIWRKRLATHLTRFDRVIVVELLPSLVLRVRDPKSGQVLAETEPGKLGDLIAAFLPVERTPCDVQG